MPRVVATATALAYPLLDSLLDDESFMSELAKVDELPVTQYVDAPFPMVAPGWDRRPASHDVVVRGNTQFVVFSMTLAMFLAGAAAAAVVFNERLTLFLH